MPNLSIKAKAPDYTVIEIPSASPSAPVTPAIQGILSSNFEDSSEVPLLKGDKRTSPIEDGMAIGFMTGSCMSILGIPIIAVSLLEAQKKISKAAAKNLKDILIPFTFPGLLVGVVGGLIGAGVGGVVSLCHKIYHAVKQRNHHM